MSETEVTEKLIAKLRGGIAADRWGGLDTTSALRTMREAADAVTLLLQERDALRETVKVARSAFHAEYGGSEEPIAVTHGSMLPLVKLLDAALQPSST